MNKQLIIGALVVVVAGTGAYLLLGGGGGENNTASAECREVCQKASNTCPSLINQTTCEQKCSKLSQESKDHLSQAGSCKALTQKPELLADLLVPEIEQPKDINPANDCEYACANYAAKCLSLVPNATEEVFQDGIQYCMNDCKKWDASKVGCMISALDCPAMTDSCGL